MVYKLNYIDMEGFIVGEKFIMRRYHIENKRNQNAIRDRQIDVKTVTEPRL